MKSSGALASLVIRCSILVCRIGYELISLLRFSFRFSRSTRLRCIFSAIFSYRSFSSFFTLFSRIASMRRWDLPLV